MWGLITSRVHFVSRLPSNLLIYLSSLIPIIMRFTAVAAVVALAAGAQAAVIDRQISVPISVSCVLDDNIIDILKRWEEPKTTITKSVTVTATGPTSYTTTTVTSTATPYGGICPCTGGNASKKRFIEERQISVPVEVTCTLDNNVVTVGTTLLSDVGGLLGGLLGGLGGIL